MRFENPTRGGRLARLVQALLIGAALALAGGTPASAQEVLTNESVVGMVKAGLPETVIIQKIRSASRKFDNSTDGLIKLKRAGVPDKVIEAMVSELSVPPTAAASTADPAIAYAGTGGEKKLSPTHGVKEMSAAPFVGSRQGVVLTTALAEGRAQDHGAVLA